MSRITILTLSTLLLATPRLSVAAPPAAPVAIIYGLTGNAFHTDPGQPRRAARLLDRLPAGATLEVGPGSRLDLAFSTGLRWRLGSGARGVLGTEDLASHVGAVRRLLKVPLLPPLAPISNDEHAGLSAGAVIIRGEGITGLYPQGVAKALAGSTVLRFKPLGGVEKYRVEIQDRQGAAVVSLETAEPLVKIPAETLRPGTAYHWTVCTVDRPGPAAKGEADFTTLDAESARRRDNLQSSVKHPEDIALLAGVDRQLGLLAEAREELASALQADPENPALRAALADLDRDLAADQGSEPSRGMLRQRDAWDRAEACFRRALHLEPEESLGAARELGFMGNLARRREDLATAEALTLPEHPGNGQENGLLQVWEIFDSVRIDAEYHWAAFQLSGDWQ